MLVANQRQVCQLPSLPSQLRLPTTHQPRVAAAATLTQVHSKGICALTPPCVQVVMKPIGLPSLCTSTKGTPAPVQVRRWNREDLKPTYCLYPSWQRGRRQVSLQPVCGSWRWKSASCSVIWMP